jgi:acetyl-CoA carboxylase biotin carboxyl carrier protein
MKVKDIQDLLQFISASGLNEVNLKTAEIELHVKRSADAPAVSFVESPAIPTIRPIAPVYAPQLEAAPVQAVAPVAPAASNDNGNYITIKSPMVGTFYLASGPEKPNFVEVGDAIKPGKVVCIIEAMKLFNEIESDVTGKIVKILVNNASPVEFDQPLFLIDPNA